MLISSTWLNSYNFEIIHHDEMKECYNLVALHVCKDLVKEMKNANLIIVMVLSGY